MNIKGFKNSIIGKLLKLDHLGKKKEATKESKLMSSHLSKQNATADPRKVKKGRVKNQKNPNLISRVISRFARKFFKKSPDSSSQKMRTPLISAHRQSPLSKETSGPKKQAVHNKKALAKEEKAIQKELSDIRKDFHQLIHNTTDFRNLKPGEKYQNIVIDTYAKLDNKALKQRLKALNQSAELAAAKRRKLGLKSSHLRTDILTVMEEVENPRKTIDTIVKKHYYSDSRVPPSPSGGDRVKKATELRAEANKGLAKLMTDLESLDKTNLDDLRRFRFKIQGFKALCIRKYKIESRSNLMQKKIEPLRRDLDRIIYSICKKKTIAFCDKLPNPDNTSIEELKSYLKESEKILHEIKFSANQNIANPQNNQDTVQKLVENILESQKIAQKMLEKKKNEL